jgi:hypothetical protein
MPLFSYNYKYNLCGNNNLRTTRFVRFFFTFAAQTNINFKMDEGPADILQLLTLI